MPQPAFDRLARPALDVLGAVLIAAACVAVLYYWDPTRVWFKRIMATDGAMHETVDSRFRDWNAAAFIHVRDAATLADTRRRLIRVIWGDGGLPAAALPDGIVRDVDKSGPGGIECPSGPREYVMKTLACEAGDYAGWDNLAGIDDLRVTVRSPSTATAYTASVARFRPLQGNGTLIVYQHGYAGTYHAQHRHLARLVAAGFTVLAANLADYGDNLCRDRAHEPWCIVTYGTFDVPFPLRVHFDPLVKAINLALGDGDLRDVAMVGFSAGAWITAVLAAVDTRIRASYPVAGVMPRFLRIGNESPPLQDYPPLTEVAGMLDLFVLGAVGPGRRQLQFFNRHDRCCYNGTRSRLYETAVREAVGQAGGGAFGVVIDETHARHKISRWTFDRILGDLGAP